jgi:hypothetical protein
VFSVNKAPNSLNVPRDLDELANIVDHVLGFGVPDSLREVRVALDHANIDIYFDFEGLTDPTLVEEAQTIGTEVISHASAGMNIVEHISFAGERSTPNIGTLVFERRQ